MTTRKQVLAFRELPPDQLARLQAVHEVTVADPRKPAQRAAFNAALAGARGLIGASFPVGAELLARAPQLQAISSISVGVDNYDLRALERVDDLFGAALGRNRDEWMLRMRRMGSSCPCKQPGRPIARFRPNPSGKCLAGRSAALRRLLIAELSTAHRALHPIPARLLRGSEKIVNTFLQSRGIVLCHTPGVLDATVADTVFALILATCRRVVELSQMVREGRWASNIGEDLFGHDVHGKTLGLLGFGRIGQAVARRAALGFGMPVLYHARRPVDLAAQAPMLLGRAEHVPLGDLLARADIVVALLPLSDSTRGLVDARAFAAMKPGAVFINGGRGATVVEDDLLAALDHGTLRAAGLDVFATEPLPLASPLRTHPRVTPLPHIGSATHGTRHAMARLAVTNLLQALAGETPTAVYRTIGA